MRRIKEFDVARGICILLIVLGHCFPSNIYQQNDLLPKLIYDFVYLFHVPCLFFISGVLFYNSIGNTSVKTIAKKTKRIILPYLSFSLLYVPLRFFASEMANSSFDLPLWQIIIGNSPNGGVWFLYALFIYYLISMLFVRDGNIEFFCLAAFVMYYVGRQGFLGGEWNNIISNFVWFVCGLLICKYKRVGCGWILSIQSNIELLLRITLLIISFYLIEAWKINLRVVCAVLGISIVMYISIKIVKSSFFSELGTHSMEIYLLHGPILIVMRSIAVRIGMPISVIWFVLFVVGLFGSYALGKLLSRVKYLGLLLFGKEIVNEQQR